MVERLAKYIPDAILVNCCSAVISSKTKNMGHWREGSTANAILPTLSFYIVGSHNEVGGITFRANPVEVIILIEVENLFMIIKSLW